MLTDSSTANVLVEQRLRLRCHELGGDFQPPLLVAVVLTMRQQANCSDVPIWRANDERLDSRIDDGSEAHHAWLKRGVKNALALVLVEKRGCSPNG